MKEGIGFIAGHVDDARVRKVEGLGHAGPLLQPEIIADELRQYFERTLPRAGESRPGAGM